jgi:tetratricopeptide (TPR) repeat protein
VRCLLLALLVAPGTQALAGVEGPRTTVVVAVQPPGVAPAERLAWASSLARSVASGQAGPDDADLAVAALGGLLDDPRLGRSAALALRDLFLSSAPRAAWVELMQTVRDRKDIGDTTALRLQLNASWVTSARTRDWAVSDLAGLLRASRLSTADRARAMALIAEARWREGEVDAARAVLEDATALDPAVAPDLQLALLVWDGRADEAHLRSPGPTGCVGADTPLPCGLWLDALGFPDVGTALIASAAERNQLPIEQRVALYLELARRARAQADFEGASHSVMSAVELDPRNVELRGRAVAALLAAGQTGRARDLAPARDESLQRAIQAVESVRGDGAPRDVADSQLLIERAAAAAPQDPMVQRAWVRHLAQQGRSNEAMVAGSAFLESWPTDREVLELVGAASVVSHQPQIVLPLVRNALRATQLPWEWRELQGLAARLMAAQAEELKRAGQGKAAVDAYLLALATRPADIAVLIGSGGALWSEGRAQEALDLLTQAHRQDPSDSQATTALVRLLASLERYEEARQVLRTGASRLPERAQLERRIEVLQVTSEVRRTWQAGDRDAARSRLEELRLRYPDEPEIHHALADLMLGEGLVDEAVSLYQRSIALDPESPWPWLGLANAWLSRGGEADLLATEDALSKVDINEVAAVEAAYVDAAVRLRRARADRALAMGLHREAFDGYAALLELRGDTWVLAGLGSLYLERWQFGLAEAFYQDAVDLDATNMEAWRGLAIALMGRGAWDEAEQLLRERDLLRTELSPGRTFERELVERQSVARAQAALRADDAGAANRELERALQRWPDSAPVLATLSDVQLASGEADAALKTALRALSFEPADEGALGAAVAAAYGADRLEVVVPYLDAALRSGEPLGSWVADELALIRLRTFLDRARKVYEHGERRRARQAVELAAERMAGDQPLHQLVLGTAWMDVNEPVRARACFERVMESAPDDAAAVQGMAGALQALGRSEDAEALLAAEFAASGDPYVGADLARVRAALGHPRAASETVDAVAARPTIGPVERERELPDPLPAILLPTGRRAGVDATLRPGVRLEVRVVELKRGEAGQEPPAGSRAAWEIAPTARTPVDIAQLRRDVAADGRWRGMVGFGLAARRGGPGTTQIAGGYVPVVVEGVVADPLRLSIEALPMRFDDGVDTAAGVGLAAGLSSPDAGRLAWGARIGTSPLGMDQGAYATFHGNLRLRTWRAWELALSGTRAPVVETVFSLEGDAIDASGRVRDTWLNLRASTRTLVGTEAGLIGRVGQLDGLQLDPLGWGAVIGWLRVPFTLGPLDVKAGGEGISMVHSLVADEFYPGQAGTFTPDLYAGLRGRLTAAWEPDDWQLCATAGAGPQWLREEAWYQAVEMRVGWDAGLGVRTTRPSSWWLAADAHIESGYLGRGSSVGMLSVGRGESDANLAVPGPTQSAVAHGLRLSERGACAVGGL